MNFVIILSVLLLGFCKGKFFLLETEEKMARNQKNIDQDYDDKKCDRGQVFSPKDGECHEVMTRLMTAAFGTKIKPRYKPVLSRQC